jgi:outer membrane protein TolC
MTTFTAAALLVALSQTSSVLTLDDALARASEANLDLAAVRERVAQAREELWKAWSQQLPQLTGGASYTRNSQEVRLDLPTGFHVRDTGVLQGPPAGGAVPGAPTTYAVVPSGVMEAVIQRRDQLGAQVQATQALLAPQLWFAIDAAGLGARAAERSLSAARQDVLFGVAQAYYGMASLAEALDVANRLVEIARRQEADARARYLAGTVPKVALVRAEIDRARAEQDVVRATNAHASARVGLALLLDRPPDFEVVRPPEPALPTDPRELEDLAMRDRPDLQAARLSEAAAGALRRSTAMRYLPALGAFARYEVSNVRGFTGERDAWAAGLAVSLTIFDGGLREAELRQASARAAEAVAVRRGVEARARAEVSQALLDLGSARASAAKAREQRDLAAENLRLVAVSYQAGAAIAVEQADATASLRNAEIAVTTETLAADLAALRVLKAAGVLERLAGGKAPVAAVPLDSPALLGSPPREPVVAVPVAVAVGGPRTRRLPAHPLPVYSGRVDRAR